MSPSPCIQPIHPLTRSQVISLKESFRRQLQPRTTCEPVERHLTSLSHMGCISKGSMSSRWLTDSKAVMQKNMATEEIKGKGEMSVNSQNVVRMRAQMMSSGKSEVEGLLQKEEMMTDQMVRVQREKEGRKSLPSLGPIKPITTQSIGTTGTFPLPIRRTQFGNIPYSIRKRPLRTSRAKF